jgi:hypothetical protein
MMENKGRSIPFVKPARVGNYKLWRSRSVIPAGHGDGSGKKGGVGIETINVSNLDGSWSVRIPQTSGMYGVITAAYAEGSGHDVFLKGIFRNMMSVCLIENVYIHDAFNFLLDIMQYPYMLLPEKEMEKRMRETLKAEGWDKARIKDYISKMTGHRQELYSLVDDKIQRFVADYEDIMRSGRQKSDEAERQMDQDDLADQALDVLNGSEQA